MSYSVRNRPCGDHSEGIRFRGPDQRLPSSDCARLFSANRLSRSAVKSCRSGVLLYAEHRLGLNEVGIYRLSGSKVVISQLRLAYDTRSSSADLSSEDIHNVTGLLKLWLRELPEPVIPFDMYPAFIATTLLADYEERMYGLRNLIWSLPRPNFTLLRRLVEHLEQ